MRYAAEERQDYLDHNLSAEADARLSAARRRHFSGGCPSCGGVPDGMQWLDVSDLAEVYSVHTLGELRRYLRETAAEGTKWYRRQGDTESVLYYSCWQCGPEVPPAEYREIGIGVASYPKLGLG
ncbi:MAG: hypothetical protein ABIG63_16325 [Chloroflexota bacterium]